MSKLRFILRNGDKILQEYLFVGYVPRQDGNGEFCGMETEEAYEWFDVPLVDTENIDKPIPF